MATLDFRRTVIACVTMLAEAFTRQASEAMHNAYLRGLAGMTPDDVERATDAALTGSKFMPSPAELRELGGSMRLTDRAERAWMAFDQAISQHSLYKTLLFDDVVINAVIRSLGGLAIAVEMDSDEYASFYRAKFLKAYEALARGRVGSEQCGALLGEFDKTNGTNDAPLVIACGMTPLPGLPKVEDLIRITSAPSVIPLLPFKKAD